MKPRAVPNPMLLCLSAALAACELEHQLDPGTDTAASATSVADSGTDSAGDGIALEDAAQVMAEARCGSFFACECGEGVFGVWADMDACVASVRADVQAQLEIGTQRGLAYDPTCAERFAGYYAQPGCAGSDAGSQQALTDALGCSLFVGTDDVGAACSFAGADAGVPRTHTCAPGLVCPQGECVAPGAAGAPCNGTVLQECADGLACDVLATPPVCAPRLALGAACGDGSQCAAETFCDDDVCTAQAAAGEACRSAFGCLYGTCEYDGIESRCTTRTAACDPQEIQVVDSCDQAREALQAFIEDNRACEDVSDCVGLSALCHDQTQCGQIAVSADHDADALDAAMAFVDEQCQDCGADPCGGTLVCDAGTCRVTL